jgi:hypothetical protein
MLAVGLAMFCLRYLIPAERWSERAAQLSFWSLNLGLAWMCFATLLPLGLLQLYESVNKSYYDARTLEFLTNDTNALIEWMRLPGDILFIAGGVLPVLYLCWLGIRHTVPRVTLEEETCSPRSPSPPSGSSREGLTSGWPAAYGGGLIAAAVVPTCSPPPHARSDRYRTGLPLPRPPDAWECGGSTCICVRSTTSPSPATGRAHSTPARPGRTDSDDGRELRARSTPGRAEAGRTIAASRSRSSHLRLDLRRRAASAPRLGGGASSPSSSQRRRSSRGEPRRRAGLSARDVGTPALARLAGGSSPMALRPPPG